MFGNIRDLLFINEGKIQDFKYEVDIENGVLHLYITPIKTIKYIQFNFIAKNSNVSFDEVIKE